MPSTAYAILLVDDEGYGYFGVIFFEATFNAN